MRSTLRVAAAFFLTAPAPASRAATTAGSSSAWRPAEATPAPPSTRPGTGSP
jgi:hypothetical protein